MPASLCSHLPQASELFKGVPTVLMLVPDEHELVGMACLLLAHHTRSRMVPNSSGKLKEQRQDTLSEGGCADDELLVRIAAVHGRLPKATRR